MERNEHIPVRNVYYMLAYAFHALRLASWRKAGTEPFDDVHNLFAALFAEGIGWQLRQGLRRDYVETTEDLRRLRGRLSMPGVIRNRAARRLRLACTYDEFSENHRLNQIVCSAAEALLHAPQVRAEYRNRLRQELALLSVVDRVRLETVPWSRLTFPPGARHLEFLVHLAELLTKGLLQTETRGKRLLAEALDPTAMEKLYEKFLLGYFQMHFPDLSPRARQIPWAAEGTEAYLPAMQSDVSLRRGGRELILDAKWYTHTMQERWGKKTQHSHNLYQIFTYVQNAQRAAGAAGTVSGMLLYARTDEAVQPDQTYVLAGRRIAVRTLDMNREFSHIEADLRRIAADYFPDTKKGDL